MRIEQVAIASTDENANYSSLLFLFLGFSVIDEAGRSLVVTDFRFGFVLHVTLCILFVTLYLCMFIFVVLYFCIFTSCICIDMHTCVIFGMYVYVAFYYMYYIMCYILLFHKYFIPINEVTSA